MKRIGYTISVGGETRTTIQDKVYEDTDAERAVRQANAVEQRPNVIPEVRHIEFNEKAFLAVMFFSIPSFAHIDCYVIRQAYQNEVISRLWIGRYNADRVRGKEEEKTRNGI